MPRKHGLGPTKRQRLPDLDLGPLGVDELNRTLGHDMEAGHVVFTAAAQLHAAKRHPDDFARCLPHVGAVIARPQYVGDDLDNPGKIELVARVPALGGGGLLVAVVVEPDPQGRYRVASMYPISEKTIENRRQRKHLHIPFK